MLAKAGFYGYGGLPPRTAIGRWAVTSKVHSPVFSRSTKVNIVSIK